MAHQLQIYIVLMTINLSFCVDYFYAKQRASQVQFTGRAQGHSWQYGSEFIWSESQGYNSEDNYREPKYRVEDATPSSLVITNLALEESGMYTVHYDNFDLDSFNMIVFNNIQCGSTIRNNGTMPLEYTCTIQYRGGFHLTLRWLRNDQDLAGVINTTDDEGLMNVTNRYTRANPTGEDHLLDLKCQVAFNGRNMRVVDNATCYQRHEVQHAVSSIMFYADAEMSERVVSGQRFDEGDMIYAKPDGFPLPTLTWTCNGDRMADGNSLEVRGGLLRGNGDLNRCEVTATNTRNSMNANIEFFGVAETTTKKPSGGGSNAASAGAIAAAVIIPILIIVIVVVIGGYFILKTRTSGGGIAAAVIIPIAVVILVIAIVGYILHKKRRAQKEGGAAAEAGADGNTNEKNPYVNATFQGSQPDVKSAPSIEKGFVPVREINPQAQPFGPPAYQGYPGRNSPGFGDLGISQLNGSVPSLRGSKESVSNPNQKKGAAPVISTDPRGPNAPRGAFQPLPPPLRYQSAEAVDGGDTQV